MGAKFIDLTSKTFGHLTVMNRTQSAKNKAARWVCKCECGGSTVTTTDALNAGKTRSCGCQRGRPKDIKGQTFGRLTVLDRDTPDDHQNAIWLCICQCGTKTSVRGSALRTGTISSCGCLRIETITKHGKLGTPEYRSWNCMKERCLNPKHHGFKYWGGRGITICESWRDSFEKFYADLGDKPTRQHTIDRINNDLNYSCGKCEDCQRNGWTANCKWSTAKEQMNNRRCSKKYKLMNQETTQP